MGLNLAQKILKAHLVEGEMTLGKQVGIRIDQTLTQDATGTMAYLQFEAMGVPRVKTKLSVSYIDHNMLQDDFRNADDHRYLQSVAAKYGIYFSRPGNGICPFGGVMVYPTGPPARLPPVLRTRPDRRRSRRLPPPRRGSRPRPR